MRFPLCRTKRERLNYRLSPRDLTDLRKAAIRDVCVDDCLIIFHLLGPYYAATATSQSRLFYCDNCDGSSEEGLLAAQSMQTSKQSRANCSARPFVPVQSWPSFSFVPWIVRLRPLP